MCLRPTRSRTPKTADKSVLNAKPLKVHAGQLHTRVILGLHGDSRKSSEITIMGYIGFRV